MKTALYCTAILLLASGCSDFIQGIALKDCGADVSCLKEALEECSPAKYSATTFLIPEVTIRVLGKEADKCKVYSMAANSQGKKLFEKTCSYSNALEEYEKSWIALMTASECPKTSETESMKATPAGKIVGMDYSTD